MATKAKVVSLEPKISARNLQKVPSASPIPTYEDSLRQTRSWLSLLDHHKLPINLEGLWRAKSDGYLWQLLNIVPKSDSESRYDYSVWYGSGACLATNVGLFHARLDPLSGVLNATPSGQVGLIGNHQLIALFDREAKHYFDMELKKRVTLSLPLQDEPREERRYIPVPSSLFLLSCNNPGWWGQKYDYDSMEWHPPQISTNHPDILQHRYLFHPQTLVSSVGIEEIEALFIGNEAFVEEHRYIFRISHSDSTTSSLEASKIIQMFRPWIPRSIQSRLAEGQNKSVIALLT